MSIIYGIDTKKPISAIKVRDALVECFIEAHREMTACLDNKSPDLTPSMKEYMLNEFVINLANLDNLKPRDKEKTRRENIKCLIISMFKEQKSDFNHPSKESILNVLKKLKNFASHYRSTDIIEKHYGDIKKLIDML